MHVVAQIARVADGFVDLVGHFVHGQVRNGAVQGGCADKGVNAAFAGVFHRLPAAVDIGEIGAGQTADAAVFRPLGNLADGLKITFRRDGETGFDDIDAHFVQQLGNFQLFVMGHGRAGALFAVAQSGVKDQDAVLVGHIGHGISLSSSVLKPFGARASSSERARRMARSEAD